MSLSLKKSIGALSLLLLFVTYQTCIIAFTHVHYINGVLITHSHPFQDEHTHSKNELVVIGYLSSFQAPDFNANASLEPVRMLLEVLAIGQVTPFVKGEISEHISLRAPPFYLF